MRESLDLKTLLAVLYVGAVLQFLFREATFAIIPIPLHIYALSYLGLLGTAGLMLELVGMMAILAALWRRLLLAAPLAVILAVSSVLAFVYPQYYATNLWTGVTLTSVIFTAILGIEGMARGEGRRRASLLTALPLLIAVDVEAFLLYLHDGLLYTDYPVLFLVAAIGAGVTSVLFGKPWGKRAALSYGLGAAASLSLMPLYLLVTQNRFMEIIMDMTIPSAVGITLTDPYSLGLVITSFSVVLFSVVSLLVKGRYLASAGFFLFFSTVFMGITGYHLMLYVVAPGLGLAMTGLDSLNLIVTKRSQSNAKSSITVLKNEVGEKK
jgi:hypothetical protein